MIEHVMELVVVFLAPILGALGALIASKFMNSRRTKHLEKLLSLSLKEIEFLRSVEAEHVEHARLHLSQSTFRAMRSNAENFAQRFSTHRFSPSKIRQIRARFKIE